MSAEVGAPHDHRLHEAAFAGGATAFEHLAVVSSTMDVAHERASAGAGAGLVILADRQERGRGRGGNRWHSARPDGVWTTIVERPRDASSLGVLALRVGLWLADALDPLAPSRVRLKWPNDLYAGAGKLGGVLVESRWRGATLDWVAVGVGVNLVLPDGYEGVAAPLGAGVSRADALLAIVRAVRGAAAVRGATLAPDELARWAARDAVLGAELTGPVVGRAAGITAGGALRVQGTDGVVEVRAGSLGFRDADWAARA